MLPEQLDVERKNSAIFKNKQKWQMQKWLPHYEQIVALSCTGVSNKYLADKFDYTPVHISNILNTPQAKQIKQVILEKARAVTLESDIPERIERIKDAALSVVEEVMIRRREELTLESPFAMLDRAQKVLAGVGLMRTEGGISVGKIEINETLQLALVDTIKKADEAHRLHSGDLKKVG
jgi:hypothetical protein